MNYVEIAYEVVGREDLGIIDFHFECDENYHPSIADMNLKCASNFVQNYHGWVKNEELTFIIHYNFDEFIDSYSVIVSFSDDGFEFVEL